MSCIIGIHGFGVFRVTIMLCTNHNGFIHYGDHKEPFVFDICMGLDHSRLVNSGNLQNPYSLAGPMCVRISEVTLY